MLSEKQKMGYRSMADLARAMGVPYGTLYARLRTGFPPPSHVVNGIGRRRWYTTEEFDEIVRQYTNKES